MRPIRLETVFGARRVHRRRLRRRRVIATMATGPWTELLELALPTFRAYAWRHGYNLVTVRHDTSFGRPAAWGKVPILLELLRHYELVLWIDADAIIVDLDPDIGEEMRPGRDLYLVQHPGEPPQMTVNTGVMLLRSTDWVRELLLAAWAQDDLVDHIWWENAAIMRLLGYDVSDPATARPVTRTAWLERTQILGEVWNCYAHWRPTPGAVVHHYAGQPLDFRRQAMAADLGRLAARARGLPALLAVR